MTTYRDLIVWQKSMLLVTKIYRVTDSFPKEEIYGLTSQVKRSAISIPSNIAEGYGRNQTGDYIRFLQIAISSLYELQTQIEIAYNLNFMNRDVFDLHRQDCLEIEKMLASLIRKLKA